VFSYQVRDVGGAPDPVTSPDGIIGIAIGAYVIREAFEILR